MSGRETLRVALLHDAMSGAQGAAPDVAIGPTLDAVERALVADGHRVERVPIGDDARWFARAAGADLAFNLCEGVLGDAAGEARVIAALELAGVPFTGAGSWTAALCLRKPAVNALLDREGIAVPPFAVVRALSDVAAAGAVAGYPCVVKPAAEDASIGVTQASVARDETALAARCGEMLARWSELVVQRYVAGREINVGILCGDALPPSEIDFGAMPAGLWPIVSYESKWDEGSAEDVGAAPRCPADVCASLGAELARVALAAWRAVDGVGCGRVDMRVDDAGRPWVLEVNANPDLAPAAGLARMAAAAGIGYDALVRTLVDDALARAAGASTGASNDIDVAPAVEFVGVPPTSDGADGALLATGVH